MAVGLGSNDAGDPRPLVGSPNVPMKTCEQGGETLPRTQELKVLRVTRGRAEGGRGHVAWGGASVKCRDGV